MKTVSEKELDRLKKKGGVRVKRRLGSKKKPEPVATESEASSGAKVAEQSPVPALAPAVDLQPMAAMAASMAARDAQLETVITNNTRAVDKFRKDLAETKKPVKSVAYRHKVIRHDGGTKNLLIDYVDSIPMES